MCFDFGTVVNSINNRSLPISWPAVWCGDGFHTSDYSGQGIGRGRLPVPQSAHWSVRKKLQNRSGNIIFSKLTKVFDWIKIFELKPSSYVQVLVTLYYVVTEDKTSCVRGYTWECRMLSCDLCCVCECGCGRECVCCSRAQGQGLPGRRGLRRPGVHHLQGGHRPEAEVPVPRLPAAGERGVRDQETRYEHSYANTARHYCVGLSCRRTGGRTQRAHTRSAR